MSKTRLVSSLSAIAGLLILAGVVTVWAFPLRAPIPLPAEPDAQVKPPAATASPKPIKRVQPIYPKEAKKAGIEGKVVLRATVAKDGSVSNVDVLSGNPALVKAATDAVQQWRYAPSVTGSIVTTVTISFSLEKDRSPRPVSGGSGASGSASGGVYSVGDGASAPIPIHKPDPPYTKEAKAAKLQGTVVLSIVIGVDGAVTDAKVIEGIDKGLTQSAVDTVKTWKFKPAMKDGKPVACKVSVEISFKLF